MFLRHAPFQRDQGHFLQINTCRTAGARDVSSKPALYRGLGCLHPYLTAPQGEFQVMLWPGCPKDSNDSWRQEASCPGSRPKPCFFSLSVFAAAASRVVLLGPGPTRENGHTPDLQEPPPSSCCVSSFPRVLVCDFQDQEEEWGLSF